MIDENVWWMAVVEDEKLVGIITENDVAKAMSQFRDVVRSQYQDSRVRKLLVSDIMVADVVFARTNTSCVDVVDLMLKHDVEGVPILNLNDTMVGVITQNRASEARMTSSSSHNHSQRSPGGEEVDSCYPNGVPA